MQLLAADIKHKFFEFLNGQESISNFENWVYETSTLEAALGAENYFDLISFDFAKRDSKSEIDRILRRHIDLSEYNTWKLKQLLIAFIDQIGNPQAILFEFYDLYCHGYDFLDSLGLGYGLSAKVSPSQYHQWEWEYLSSEQQIQLIDSLFPGAKIEAQKVLDWLDTETIVLTSDRYNRLSFIDRRTEAEKVPIWCQENSPYRIEKHEF
jgi:hypothetical protein